MDSFFKNVLITVLIFMFIITGLVLIVNHLPSILDVQFPDDDPKLYAGKSEFCKNNIIDLSCAEGLECIIVDNNGPYEIGVCLTKGITKDDPEYRDAYDKYLNNKIEIKKESFN